MAKKYLPKPFPLPLLDSEQEATFIKTLKREKRIRTTIGDFAIKKTKARKSWHPIEEKIFKLPATQRIHYSPAPHLKKLLNPKKPHGNSNA